jgi:hypothetical protein
LVQKKIPTAPQVSWAFVVVRPPPKESALANSSNNFQPLVQKKIPTTPQVSWAFVVVRPPQKESALANSPKL